MCFDIRGLLDNYKHESGLGILFTGDEGAHPSDGEAREYLWQCIERGWEVLPGEEIPTTT